MIVTMDVQFLAAGVKHLPDPGRLEDAIFCLQCFQEGTSDQPIEATLQIRDFGSEKDCLNLAEAVQAANGVNINALVLSTKTVQLLLAPPGTNRLQDILCSRLPDLTSFCTLPAPGSQFHKPEDLDITASLLLKCKNLHRLEIGPFENAGFTEECIHNFANAMENIQSLRSVSFAGCNVVVQNAQLSSRVIDALATLPNLSTLYLDMWIPPLPVQTPGFQAKLARLLARVTHLTINHKKIPDAYSALQCSSSIRTLTVNFSALCWAEYSGRLGDLVCKLDYAPQLKKLVLFGEFEHVNNDAQALRFLEALKDGTKLKTLVFDLYKCPKLAKVPKISKALQSSLRHNLTLLSVQCKLIPAPLVPAYSSIIKMCINRTYSPIIKMYINRNKLLKKLVEDPQASVRESTLFLSEHNRHINTTFSFLSKKLSLFDRIQRYKALVQDPKATKEDCWKFLEDYHYDVNASFCLLLSKKKSFLAGLLAPGLQDNNPGDTQGEVAAEMP